MAGGTRRKRAQAKDRYRATGGKARFELYNQGTVHPPFDERGDCTVYNIREAAEADPSEGVGATPLNEKKWVGRR